VTFYDLDVSTTYDPVNDTIFEVMNSSPAQFELTNDPYVAQVSPQRPATNEIVTLTGLNFGPTQGDGEMRIGMSAAANNPALGQGIKVPEPYYWSSTMLKCRIPFPGSWECITPYIWVEKDGDKSNITLIQFRSGPAGACP
jgi:hypothetical protein